jgi:hypothetical protein
MGFLLSISDGNPRSVSGPRKKSSRAGPLLRNIRKAILQATGSCGGTGPWSFSLSIMPTWSGCAMVIL